MGSTKKEREKEKRIVENQIEERKHNEEKTTIRGKKNPPFFIYLQCYDQEDKLLPLESGSVTWCTEKREKNDAKYILVNH